jgi:hypothetical protein
MIRKIVLYHTMPYKHEWRRYEAYTLNNGKANLMGTVNKSATSTFQYGDPVTLNVRIHGYSLRDKMQHLNITFVIIMTL